MSLEQAEKEFDRRAKILHGAFSTPGGKEALELLQNLFDLDDCRGASVEDTYYKLGQREVVKYIEALLRRVGEYE